MIRSYEFPLDNLHVTISAEFELDRTHEYSNEYVSLYRILHILVVDDEGEVIHPSEDMLEQIEEIVTDMANELRFDYND